MIFVYNGCVLPVGIVEQHGFYSPLGVNAYEIEDIVLGKTAVNLLYLGILEFFFHKALAEVFYRLFSHKLVALYREFLFPHALDHIEVHEDYALFNYGVLAGFVFLESDNTPYDIGLIAYVDGFARRIGAAEKLPRNYLVDNYAVVHKIALRYIAAAFEHERVEEEVVAADSEDFGLSRTLFAL